MIVDRFYFQEHRMFWAAAGFTNGLVLIQYRGFIWAKLGLLLLLAVTIFLWRQKNLKSLLLFFYCVGWGAVICRLKLPCRQKGYLQQKGTW